MKKLALLVTTLIASANLLYSQGQITFANSASSLVNLDGSPAPTSVMVQLYYGNSMDSGTFQAAGTAISLLGTSSVSTGRFSGGLVTLNGADSGSLFASVRAWDSASGATWDTATVKGESGVFAALFNIGTTPRTSILDPLGDGSPGFTGIDLVAVPEPSTIAMIALGLGAVVFRFRRK